jgi:hypothetical protein
VRRRLAGIERALERTRVAAVIAATTPLGMFLVGVMALGVPDGDVTIISPAGNAAGWGGKQWLYFAPSSYEAALAGVTQAIRANSCGQVIVGGFSNGGTKRSPYDKHQCYLGARNWRPVVEATSVPRRAAHRPGAVPRRWLPGNVATWRGFDDCSEPRATTLR